MSLWYETALSAVRPRESGEPELQAQTSECLALGSRLRGNERGEI